jgi:Flp pilus assembly protein TadG
MTFATKLSHAEQGATAVVTAQRVMFVCRSLMRHQSCGGGGDNGGSPNVNKGLPSPVRHSRSTALAPPRCRRRRHDRGQSLVEFSLAFPLFMLLVAVAFTGSAAMSSVIGLSGAARAGAIAAANDVAANANVAYQTELNHAVAAINAEEGCTSCYTGATDQASCAANSNCVWIVKTHGSRAANSIDVVHVQHPIVQVIPLLSNLMVQAQAGATP